MISPLPNSEAYYPQPCHDRGSWQLLLNQTGPHPSLSPVPQRRFVSFIISVPLWLSNGMLLYSINTKLKVALGSNGVGRIKVLRGERTEKGSGPCSRHYRWPVSPFYLLTICSPPWVAVWQLNCWENRCYFRASHTDNVFTPQRAKLSRFSGDFPHRLNNQFRTVKELCNYCWSVLLNTWGTIGFVFVALFPWLITNGSC